VKKNKAKTEIIQYNTNIIQRKSCSSREDNSK